MKVEDRMEPLHYMKKNNSILYIIGNGFDRFHDLPTRYSDFGKYIESYDSDFYNLLLDWYPTFYNNQMEDSFSLWKDFENGLKEIDQDLLWQSIDNHLTQYGVENWGDEDNHRVQYMIQNLLNSIISKLYIYLTNWICSVDVQLSSKRLCLDINAKYLTFDYTKTLESYYKIPSAQVIHIHGITDNPTSIITGHNMKLLPAVNDYDDIRLFECEKIVRNEYFEKTIKPTDKIISVNKEFFLSLNSLSAIVIIGHSLNEIDLPYFKEIRSVVSDETKWKISFKDSKDKNEHYEEKRKTLVDLGIDEKCVESFLMSDIVI